LNYNDELDAKPEKLQRISQRSDVRQMCFSGRTTAVPKCD